MLLASSPVVSESHLAARRVGATSSGVTSLAHRMERNSADDGGLADHGPPLFQSQCYVEVPLDPRQWPCRHPFWTRVADRPAHAARVGDGILRVAQIVKEDAGLARERLREYGAFGRFQRKRLLEQRAVDLEQLLSERQQVILWQSASPFSTACRRAVVGRHEHQYLSAICRCPPGAIGTWWLQATTNGTRLRT
jgi:hypothetical protein